MLQVHLQLPENRAQHYLHQIKTNPEAPLVLKILEKQKDDLYNHKFIAEVEELKGLAAEGKIMLLIPKDSSEIQININDKILAYAAFEQLPKQKNPHGFEYDEYLRNKNIYRQISLRNQFIILENKAINFQEIAESARTSIIEKLEEHAFKDDELAIIQALLLGDKKDISEEVHENYVDAGVIHILAVSGLHVGIILLILNYLLSPLNSFKYGRLLKIFLLIFLLWSFAFLAGLSASIIRAVTMFSFVAVGMQLKRKTNILNTVFASLLLLLFVNPLYLFDVGFQLSYSAVTAIVLFQPLIHNFWKPKHTVSKFLWSTFSVTLAAQAGVLPLSLFYFHQFPGLFFISNLVILPGLGLLIGLGILVIILAVLDVLPDFIARSFEVIIQLLNNFIEFVAHQEAFIFKSISFSLFQAIASFLLLFALFFFLKNTNVRQFKALLVATILLQAAFIYEKHEKVTSELIIFHKSRNSLIGTKENADLKLYSDWKGASEANFIQAYQTEEGIHEVKSEEIQNFLIFKNQRILIVDSLGLYDFSNLEIDYILLRNSPQINLDRLLQCWKSATIIADGSNYPSYVARWKRTCEKTKTPFHNTREKGAFLVKL